MALSTSRTLITKTGISTAQVFDMGGISISGGDFNLGNAIKYICRAGYKSPQTKAEDLKKAIHYLENELEHTSTQQQPIPLRPSNSVPTSLWNPELDGEPDYATGFDR